MQRSAVIGAALALLGCSSTRVNTHSISDAAAGTSGSGAGGSAGTSGGSGSSTGGSGGTTGGTGGSAGGVGGAMGGVGGATGGSAGTTGGSAGATGGSGGAPTACNRSAPFRAPTLITELNSSAEELGARLSPDLLTVYFASSRNATTLYDIFVGTRDTPEQPFTAIGPLANVNSPQSDFSPSIAEDGFSLFIETDRRTDVEIMVASRSSVVADFTQSAPVAALRSTDTTLTERSPFVTNDGKEIYFTRRSATDAQIYRAERSTGSFGMPEPVTELNGAGLDSFATPSADGRTIYFASTRTAPGAKGLQDIWVATRAARDQPFSGLELVPELNSAEAEYPNWVSADRRPIYLHRSTGRGNEIYVARRPAP